MSKDNMIVPDISFELGTGDLSINDIMSQNREFSSEDDSNEYDNRNNYSGYSNEYEQEEKTYSLDNVEEFKTENPEDIRSQIETEVNNASFNKEEYSDESNKKDYNVDIYSAALQILKEQNILNIPDDISELDENTLNQLIEYDQELRNQQAFDYVKSQTSDPRLSELIDHVLNGGEYEDAIAMKEIIDEQYDFYNLDVQVEDTQRMLIDMYIREGLNPDSAVDQRRLARLDDEIDMYINNLEGEDLAGEAKNYFIEKIEYIKEFEKQKIQERKIQTELYQRQKLQQEQFWINDFKKTLNEKPWSNDKKKEIVSQFDIVQLDNGTEMEMWKYKWSKIWERPDLTQVFMDFLSDLDPHQLEFKNRNIPVQKQVTSKILDIVNNKKTISNKFKSEGRNYSQSDRQGEQTRKSINPSSDW
jgi:hypothetical protein